MGQEKQHLGAGGVAPSAGHDIPVEEPSSGTPLGAPGIGQPMGWDRGRFAKRRQELERERQKIAEIVKNRSS